MINAKVICHSQAPNGEELITVEVEFHRFILAEINTHRVLSRNYQSSRAVPVEKMIEQVRNDPAIPVHWGKNQRGMVADEESTADVQYYQDNSLKTVTSVGAWMTAAKAASFWAENLHNAGYHKQVVNRILEPYIWTKGVITATREGWDSVFKLRCHKDAQPEFQALASKIKEAIENSTPDVLNVGDWHLPYVKYMRDGEGNQKFIANREEGGRWLSLSNAIKISTSCIAQVSYRTIDDSLSKAERIYDLLNLPEGGVFNGDPPHFSPAEGVAKCYNYIENQELGDNLRDNNNTGGNFNTTAFYQYRKMLEQGTEKGQINE